MHATPAPTATQTVRQTLRALGGQGTVGDLLGIAALPRAEIERALHELMSDGRVQVKVPESGTVIYHLPARDEDRREVLGLDDSAPVPRDARFARAHDPWRRGLQDTPVSWYDRRTLRLIRAREGVISLAELVEHTGLPLREAREEMRRLVRDYRGVPRPSLDDHVVYAFPELMDSAHRLEPVREPRPAWVRREEPVPSAAARRRLTPRGAWSLAGVAVSVAAPLPLLTGAKGMWADPVAALVLAASATGLILAGRLLVHALADHELFRFRRRRTLRRYALGVVYETALRGKGVVSLKRTVAALRARAGKRRVSARAVEDALRELAREFDAPITKQGDDLFFGFRNVKRQFLASDLQRRRMRLGASAWGDTVFDSADSPSEAIVRDLEWFDRALREGDPRPVTRTPPPNLTPHPAPPASSSAL